MSERKKADKQIELGGTPGLPLESFHGYDLQKIGLPIDARPIAGQHYAGKHGFTIRSNTGAVLWSSSSFGCKLLEVSFFALTTKK